MLGFWLKKLQLPIVPIILGMVLGGIMEQKFRSSLLRIDTPLDFINRPVSGTIFAIIVIALVVHFAAIICRNRQTVAVDE